MNEYLSINLIAGNIPTSVSGSLLWSRSWVTVCVEFLCMFFLCAWGFPPGSCSHLPETCKVVDCNLCKCKCVHTMCPVNDWCPKQAVFPSHFFVHFYSSNLLVVPVWIFAGAQVCSNSPKTSRLGELSILNYPLVLMVGIVASVTVINRERVYVIHPTQTIWSTSHKQLLYVSKSPDNRVNAIVLCHSEALG